ncbi:MAG: 1-acyl-sn-glycerol-3-phosphate acyltransferase [Lachnospiraceae bacterium]|jgi:1-acyl-sn-glycerol-3-phosphate acyltransferase|nr:1-acyl-sn-glycerol-3-phosphate acyltransferase [Lachnospiraceae bacterium]
MERILMMVLRLLHRVPVWAFKVWTWPHSTRHSLREKYDLLQHITRHACRAGRVTLQVHGLENIPDQPGFIFFPNHQGFFDGLTFLATCPQPFSVVMKKETANWILVKQVRLLLNAILLDRSNIKNAVEVITQMTERVKSGENFLIFPEGTRSRRGNEVGEFKGGTFKSALGSRCPIVPVALIDCFKPFDTHSIRPVTVQIHYLPPIPYEEYKGMRTREIARMVQERIETVIRENA